MSMAWRVNRRLIDDFEDGDVAEYTEFDDRGATWTAIDVGSTAYNGSFVLEFDSPDGEGRSNIISLPTDGLAHYPNRGDTFRYYFYLLDNNAQEVGIYFGADDVDRSNVYEIAFIPNDQRFGIRYNGNTLVEDTLPSYPTLDQWGYVEIDWGNPTITASVHWDGTEQQSVSADDTSRDGGGFGFRGNSDGTLATTFYYDYVVVE